MRIEKDNARFNAALKAYFDSQGLHSVRFRSVCAVDDDGTILGGCGFSPVRKGRTVCYLLGLRKGWATRQTYAAIMRFPFEDLGADYVDARTGKNHLSRNCAMQMGGVLSEDGNSLTFEKEATLKRAAEAMEC